MYYICAPRVTSVSDLRRPDNRIVCEAERTRGAGEYEVCKNKILKSVYMAYTQVYAVCMHVCRTSLITSSAYPYRRHQKHKKKQRDLRSNANDNIMIKIKIKKVFIN